MDKSKKIKAVQKMQDYIKKNITDSITLLDLAKASDLSPWFASRLFKEMTGKNPFDYIRLLRVSHAAMKLRDTKHKIIDVAFDYVFNTHEGFTRAFSKAFGIAPSTYRKTTPPIKLFIPYRLIMNSRNTNNGDTNMKKNAEKTQLPENLLKYAVFVQVIERQARKLILKRGIKAANYYDYCDEVGCDVWGILVSIKEALFEPIGLWLPDKMKHLGTSKYVMGVEVPSDYSGKIPDGFDQIDLKACKIMVFQGQPFEDEQFEDAIDGVDKVIELYKPELFGFEWADDDAPRFQMEPQGYRGYIEARPVRELISK